MTFFRFPDLGCLFIRVRKTASTSLLRGPLEGRACHPSRRFPDDWRDGLCFAFVRHPIDRLLSAWRMFQSYPREEGEWPPERELTLVAALEIVADETIDPAGSSYVEKLRLHALPATHPHYRLDRAGFVGRFERLEEDWRRLAVRLGLEPAELPHWRRTTAGRTDAPPPELQEPRVRDLARAIYREDARSLGYRLSLG